MNNDIDVLLISSPSPNPGLMISYKVQGMPPLGLGYIATYLSRSGYKVKILDMSLTDVTMKNAIKIIEDENPKLVGISTTTETFNSGVRIAERIKKLDKKKLIVMGGSHVSFKYEDALNTNVIDYVIRGEGEIAFKLLSDYVIKKTGKLDSIKGVSYTKDGNIVNNENSELIEDLNELPFPDRTLYNIKEYAHPATCSTSRGCPGKCIFCAASGLSGGRYRMRTAENIVKEFEYLKSLGFNHVDIIDDTMTASIRRLNEFLELMIEKDLKMTWYCESRVDVMSKELLKKMKKAGLTLIQFGVEAGSQKMLDCLKKKITITQIKNVFKWCEELGIMSSTNMIIGQPYDTKETIDDTIELAKEIARQGVYINFTVCTPFPGTYMWDHTEALGIKIVEKNLDNYTTFYPVYESAHLKATDIRNEYYRAVKEIALLQAKEPEARAKNSYIRRVDNLRLPNLALEK